MELGAQILHIDSLGKMDVVEDSDLYVNVLRRRKLNKLWGVEELYEVDVYRENNDVLETDFDDVINTAGIHCHICNVEVPKMYIKEHNQTSTHQNLLKLTDEALERTRNHIKNTETSGLTIKVENTYYCDICSRVVENSKKELHEESNYHKKCVNFNNLLYCFVDSYLNINDNNNNDDNNCNLENTKCDTAEYVTLLPEMQQNELFKKLEPQKIQELPKTEKQELENTDLKIELNQKQTQELNQKLESNQEILKSPKKSKSEKLNSYFETIKSKNSNKNFEIEYIPINRVKITALNKDVIIVPIQHFHSYNNKLCRVCLSDVLEENHKNSEDHISRIMTPIADKNGIREVDDIWSHCIVCNELTNTVSHNQSLNHLSNLNKYHLIHLSRSQMIQIENGQNETGNGQKQSENDQKQSKDQKKSDLKIDISPHFEEFSKSLFPIFKKVLENNSLYNGSNDHQILDRNNSPNTSENIAGNAKDTVTETYDFEILNNISDLQSVKEVQNKLEIKQDPIHNETKKFDFEIQNNKSDLQSAEEVQNKTEIKQDSVHNKIETFDFEIQNNKSDLQSVEEVQNKSEMKQDSVHNKKETFDFEIQNNKSDLQSVKEVQIKSEIEQDSVHNKNDSLKVEQKLSHYCFVCRINVTDFDTHKQLESHKIMSKEKRKRNQELKKIMIRNRWMTNAIQKSITKCGLCDVIVNYDKDLIEAHINTDGHRKNYLKFMEDNKIVLIDDQVCHCEPCDQRQSRNSVFEHCRTPQHVNKLKKHLNKDTVENTNHCFICRINIMDFETHKQLEIHKVMLKVNRKRNQELKKIMIRNYWKINQNQKSITKCGLCDVIVNYDKDLIEAHINTDSHRTNYLKFMEDNKIILIDDQVCHCEPCDQRKSRNSVFDHCRTPQHVSKLKKNLHT